MTENDALLLSHAIPDELRRTGRDDLAEAAARLGERLAELEAEVGHLERLARQQGRAITQGDANRYEREARDYRESANRHCAIGGPWTHVAIDEHYRGSPSIPLLCGHCNREPAPAYLVRDVPPPIVRSRRVSVVSLRTSTFTNGSDASPAIHVGRCEACGTWYVG